MRSMRRWTPCRARPRSPASARSSRRCAAPSRDTGLDPEAIRADLASTGRRCAPSTPPSRAICKAGASEVYLHEMPGGQFTNLKEQARSLGLETRWHEVAKAYRAANDMFGDIVKVTPSSKVVGDMALMMVAQGLTPTDVLDPDARDRLPGLGRRDAARRSRPAARRLAQGAAGQGAEGRGADHRAARLAPARGRSRRRARPRPRRRSAAPSTRTSSPPI